MKPCPNCGKPIGYGAVLLPPLSSWLTCSNCSTRFEGSRLVHLAGIGITLVGGAALVIVAFTLVFVKATAPEVIRVAAVILVAEVLVIALVQLMLVRQSGRYVVRAAGGKVPALIHRYLLAAGVVATFVLAVAVGYADYSPIGPIVLAGLAFVASLALYLRYEHRLGDKPRSAATLLLFLSSGAVLAFGSVFAVYAVANFPREGPFDEKLGLTFGDQAAEEAWYRLIDLTGSQESDREAVLDFYSQNVASVPEREFSLLGKSPEFLNILDIANSELTEIGELIGEGDEPNANARYQRLWRVAGNMLSGNVTLIQHLIAVGMISSLIEFYLDGSDRELQSSYEFLLKQSSGVEDILDLSFELAMSAEYTMARRFMLDTPDLRCLFAEIGDLRSCDLEIKWPFFDKRRTLRAHHDYMAGIVALWRQPFYESQEEVAAYREEFERLARGSLLRKPYGAELLRAIVPEVIRFGSGKEFAKSRLLAFRYILEAARSGELGDVPSDPLTGKPFTVAERQGAIEIATTYMNNGKPDFNYELTTIAQ